MSTRLASRVINQMMMWLLGSYFNRAINFESMFRFRRKRKHKIVPGAARDISNKKELVMRNQSKVQREAA